MKSIKKILLLTLLSVCSLGALAQTETKSYALKKGQVFDLLMVNLKDDVRNMLVTYFEEVYPIAEGKGYHKLPYMNVLGIPTQGNYHPDAVVLGFWDGVDSRPAFLQAVEKEIPAFYENRRTIWSTFSLAYFEIEEDLNFEVDPSNFNVMTNYWQTDASSFNSFKKDWIREVKKAGGVITMELANSKSPFGYLYDPSFVTITTWESEEAFDAFLVQNRAMDHTGVKHVNQFAIQ